MCREQVAQLRDVYPQIQAKGAELVAIGNGRPEHVEGFIEDEKITFPVYTDPKRNLYKALGFKRGVGATFTLSSLKAGMRAAKEGHRQHALEGDPWQQGGLIVVNPAGEVIFHHINNDAADHAPIEKVLEVL